MGKISMAYLQQLLAGTPHAANHAPGGSDTLSGFYAQTPHTHAVGQVSGISGFYALTPHTHDATQISGLSAGGLGTLIVDTSASAAASISKTSITSGYKVIRGVCYIDKDGNGGSNIFRFNNDSAGNYEWTVIESSGVAPVESNATGQTGIRVAYTDASSMAFAEFTIWNVAGQKKLVLIKVGRDTSTDRYSLIFGIWNNTTDEINRIDIVSGANNFDVINLYLEGYA